MSTQLGHEWVQARLAFLTRLNEQRESLRHSLDRPLVLLVPIAERAQIKELIPDLWAIRDFSLVTQSWMPMETGRPPTRPLTQRNNLPFPLSEYEQSQVAEWERLNATKSDDRGFLIVAERALQACLRAGSYKRAAAIAASLLRAAKKRLQSVGETPEALRDLSVSLDNVGDTTKALGQWEEAQKCFEEGLAIANTLSRALPKHPDYIGLVDHFRNRLQSTTAK